MSKQLVIVGAALAVATTAVGADAGRQATTGQGFKVVGKWGKPGSGNGQFGSNANGIAVDAAGKVYVADGNNSRVQVFSKTGGFLATWASPSAEDVAVAPDGSVWVADEENDQFHLYSGAGASRTSLSAPTGEEARGVAVDGEGNVLAALEGDDGGFRRYDRTPTGWGGPGGMLGAGDYRADDVEVSPDGTVYLATAATQTSDDRIRRFSANGRALHTIKLGPGNGTRGIGVDLDCNVWAVDTGQRRIVKYSPSGKLLATASSPDLIANDIAVGPTGDLYVIHQNVGIVHFAEDRSKPATAAVPGTISVAKGKATVTYTASGVACPAKIDAVATLSGKGVSGRAAVKVAAGKVTAIEMKVKGPASKAVKATFTIVLRTNGRPTTEKRSVLVRFAK